VNLLQNIERYAYSSSQGGKVDISIPDHDKENFIIIFRDYGKGISEENLAKIFDPFFTTGRGKGGSGLGLAIVHNIVTIFMARLRFAQRSIRARCFVLLFQKLSPSSFASSVATRKFGVLASVTRFSRCIRAKVRKWRKHEVLECPLLRRYRSKSRLISDGAQPT
jgi:hypothetical protein